MRGQLVRGEVNIPVLSRRHQMNSIEKGGSALIRMGIRPRFEIEKKRAAAGKSRAAAQNH